MLFLYGIVRKKTLCKKKTKAKNPLIIFKFLKIPNITTSYITCLSNEFPISIILLLIISKPNMRQNQSKKKRNNLVNDNFTTNMSCRLIDRPTFSILYGIIRITWFPLLFIKFATFWHLNDLMHENNFSKFWIWSL